ncbi:MAG: alpha/beta hydrolase [Chloroflexi bacterium]|nr:alpha/beta hydrolase [Chloroflexota bacterium]
MDNASGGCYVSVNGINLYYETYGETRGVSRPLVLLHGGLGGIGMFAPLMPELSRTRQVIGVELQAHGHTADIDRPLRFEAMADDIAALIRYMGFAGVDLMGYSLGGGVALQTVIRHPQAVAKLVVVSSPCKREGWYPEVLAGMAGMNAEAAQTMVGSPMHADYVRSAPRPEDWPVLVEKMGQLLRQDYNWCSEVASIKSPAMIVIGDADSVVPAHAVEMFGLLGGGKGDAGWDGSGMSISRLAILPATTHYNMFTSPMLASVVTNFLDTPLPEHR